MKKPLENVILASDIDGTLIGRDFKIPQRNIDAIERFKNEGGIFCIASGRPMVSARQYHEIVKTNAPGLFVNGSFIYDFEKDKIIWEKAISKESLEYVRVIHKQFPNIGIEAITKDKINIINLNDQVKAHISNGNFPYKMTSLENIEDDIYKILFAMGEDDISKVDEYVSTLEVNQVRFVRTSNIFLEMLPEGISKGMALEKLLNMLNIKKENSFAVGDYYNDIEMFSIAGTGAATKDAPKDVKKHADIVVCSCDDGAVADVIEYIESKYLS